MEITIGSMVHELDSLDLKTKPMGSFRIPPIKHTSKTIDFFKDLYSYPPQFRVKWDMIDELHNDTFLSYNYRLINPTLPFLNASADFFHIDNDEVIKKTKYSLNSYIQGYFNKISRSYRS